MIEAARISSGVTGGSKLNRVLMFRRMLLLLANRDECWSLYYFTHRKVVAGQIGYTRRENRVQLDSAKSRAFLVFSWPSSRCYGGY
jgi:hypothetical protein